MNTFKRIYKITNKMITREFPGKGHIRVKVGDSVTPSDILGEVKQSAGFRIVNVALELDVKGDKAIGYIKRKEGEHIYRGEILAEKSILFSKDTKKIYASVDGIIEHVNPNNGQILIKITKKQESIPSGVWGKIVTIEDEHKIIIETQVVEINCKASRGYRREGAIKVISANHESLQEFMIKEEYIGKVLVGGGLITRHALSKAVASSVVGVVGGSIYFEDIQAVGESSDIGSTFMVTEGFGTLSMNTELYEFIKKYDNFYCFVDGKAQTLTIPLENVDSIKDFENNSSLAIGTIVRLCGDESIGVTGKVVEIIPEHVYPSGFKVSSLRLIDGKKEYVVPQSNVEILL